MRNDPQLEFPAPTRHGDPEESRLAAATITGERMTLAMEAVLIVLSGAYPFALSDEGLVYVYQTESSVRQTPQSIRSRRAQLARLGYVQEVGKAVNAAGNRCRLWRITQKGLDRVERPA